MPRDTREGPLLIDLTGDRARVLAERLLAAPADRLWDELAALGQGRRVAHDWDPATGRLTLAVR